MQTGILVSTWNVRKSTRSMPEANDIDPFLVAAEPVNDSIRPADHLAQIWPSELWHYAAAFGEGRHLFGARNQFITEPGCCIGIVPRNISNNVPQVDLC